jgi:hypothetical protein
MTRSRRIVAPRLLALALVLAGAAACAAPTRYNSLDLALLPCEEGDSPVFFRGVEFTERGAVAFPQQRDALLRRLREGPPVTDLVFFVHGWNKRPSLAEMDYQNFLCRLHARLRALIGDRKRQDGLVIVGVFWPSTLNPNGRDVLTTPVSYFQIRDRADALARTGFADLLRSISPALRPSVDGPGGFTGPHLQLIGHSFGGRMVVRGLRALHETGDLVPLLVAAGPVNVALLNAAMAPDDLGWLREALARASERKSAGRAQPPPRFTVASDAFLFNVHSRRDAANRYLFPTASLFTDDRAVCGSGACGVPGYATLCVDGSGQIVAPPRPAASGERPPPDRVLAAWNVDATEVVFDHSDIYKGRVALLVANLLYRQPGAPDLGALAQPPDAPACPSGDGG